MDMTAKRTELLASMHSPLTAAARVDGAVIQVMTPNPVEMRDGEPFFGGYMMDDMLEDMGVTQADEDTALVGADDLA